MSKLQKLREDRGLTRQQVDERTKGVVGVEMLTLAEESGVDLKPERLRVLARLYRVTYIAMLISVGHLTQADVARHVDRQAA